MSASSSSELDPEAKLSVKQIQTLLRTLSLSKLRERVFVKSAYLERAQNFDETCLFLIGIEWVEEEGSCLDLTANGREISQRCSNDVELRDQILRALIGISNPYQRHLTEYLCCFNLRGEELTYRSPVSVRAKQGSVRDFLMDLHAVLYDPAQNAHVISSHATDLYIWARNARSITAKAIELANARKADIGFDAELLALEYERQRVGPQWTHLVEHISAESPFACFDIKSVTAENKDLQTRYIEVKAISATSPKFYWTRSEIEAAQLLRSRYFLYLLPVSPDRRNFDLNQLLVVSDPYINVLQNPNGWELQSDVVVCSKRL